MTARRGSLRHKIVRLAGVPRKQAAAARPPWRVARMALRIAGRCAAVLCVLLVSATIAVQIWHAMTRNVALHAQLHRLQDQNAELLAANARLATRVQRLHDPEYLVPLIHEQLGLAKPNEVFVQVTPSTPAPASPR